MLVSLFVTCLVDQFWPSVGTATVEVLRRAGCEVEFDARQTCCGQPAFNAGHRDEARRVARGILDAYGNHAVPIVVPSGSCGAMFRHLPELFPNEPENQRRARSVAKRTHELGSFLVHQLGIEDVGAAFEGRVTWHDSCHGLRSLGIKEEPRRLIRNVRGTELVEMPDAEACCGFGGMFSVKHPELSVAMLDTKLAALTGIEADVIVGGDVSCLMQMDGRLRRQGSPLRVMHLAELLASGDGRRA